MKRAANSFVIPPRLKINKALAAMYAIVIKLSFIILKFHPDDIVRMMKPNYFYVWFATRFSGKLCNVEAL